jgi:Alpha/beta hydrolase domain
MRHRGTAARGGDPAARVRRGSSLLLAVVALVVLLCACGSSSTQAVSAVRDAGPVGGQSAVVSPPVRPGDAASLIAGAWDPALEAAGYAQREYFVSGTAHSFRAAGQESNAGTWKVVPAASAPYRTRIVVRTPTEPARFNGTVVVEWLNVSGGGDGAVDSVYLSPELERAGFAWVGVSVQAVGVDNLRQKDPARYGSLTDPGDQYSYDIFSQVGRALIASGPANPLAPLHPTRLLAVGESQSAIYLTTYIDAVQPISHVFDGFLVHSRAGGAAPVPGGSPSGNMLAGSVRIRSDIGVPVLMMITETDEMFGRYYLARQPDSRFVRLWDIAGASHADTYIVAPAELQSLGCTSIDEAPSHFVFEAALSAVDAWIRSGKPPASAPRMDVSVADGSPAVRYDSNGTAIGGIQGPWEQVPVAAYSGQAPDGAPGFCVLFGSTRPFAATELAAHYGTEANYLGAYRRATDEDIRNGFILPADRAQVLAFAEQVSFTTP